MLTNLFSGCRAAQSSVQPGRSPWITVSADRFGFITVPGGERFVPWGFNYDRDYKMRLLEDYWAAEWQTVVEDFREMKQLGANVVRIHLQLGKFMEGPNQPNEVSLARLNQLVRLAETTGLYLDLTGLGCYRKSDVPEWYAALDESRRWETQARFWDAVAARCANSPAVFCYDLMNEPVVPGEKRAQGDWLAGELAGFHYVQFISLDPRGRPRPEIAREWIARLVAAIRKHDARHLITVGLLPNSLETPVSLSGFPPSKVAAPLDFVSVHVYPKSGHLDEDLKLLAGFAVGKPVVIEEIFPLNCKPPELRQFILDSKPRAAGWIGFYWGETPAELARSTTLSAALTRQWLEVFRELRHSN